MMFLKVVCEKSFFKNVNPSPIYLNRYIKKHHHIIDHQKLSMEESTSKSFYSNAKQTMSDMYNNNIAHSYLEERAYPFWGPRNIWRIKSFFLKASCCPSQASPTSTCETTRKSIGLLFHLTECCFLFHPRAQHLHFNDTSHPQGRKESIL